MQGSLLLSTLRYKRPAPLPAGVGGKPRTQAPGQQGARRALLLLEVAEGLQLLPGLLVEFQRFNLR